MNDNSYRDPEKFADPLEDFDPKEYEDPIERALAEEPVTQIRHDPMATISPETTVKEAVAQLAGQHVACLLVEEEGKLLGVFSDRDVLDRVALESETVMDLPVRELMTTDPVYVYDTDSAAAALSVMAIAGYRHVPVVDANEDLVGIVSPQRVTAFLKEQLPQA